ncbi:MAG: hypothetical protein H8F28_11775 [Fibrella sp.]|nr:hypothetical protein [Armatimonadota bacterium]
MERTDLIKAFTDNPIVLRDLRATMRGTRAFWFQAVYLGLLGILAVTGYALSTHQSLFDRLMGGDYTPRTFSIVDAQRQLQQFYGFIFMTLGGLISLIAPALTATSVSDERQRQSLDLLITTPISATEMLVGKLMSSLAFLGVLLALSLPASALCVLLGGSTIGDMFRIYSLLAMSAVVLASIGLYFSCACKNSLHSVIWTYVSVLSFIAITFGIGFCLGENGGITQASTALPISIIGLLSPFGIIFGSSANLVLGPVTIPFAIAILPVAFLTIRLLLTAAAYRFGTFGAESGRSLRKQVLIMTGIVIPVFGYSISAKGGLLANYYANMTNSYDTSTPAFTSVVSVMWMILAGLFALSLPFLPGLFVPVNAEDAPPGDAQTAQVERDNGYFSLSAMLLPRHSGALPYFYTWLGIAVIGLILGISFGSRSHDLLTMQAILAGTLYVAGAGTLMWGLSRLAARFIRAASTARSLAFGLFILFNAIPGLPLSLITLESGEKPIAFLAWLQAPLLFITNRELVLPAILLSGTVALVIGLVIGVVSKPQKA